jgi:hypothetical protein
MRSVSGLRPVISMSIQMRRLASWGIAISRKWTAHSRTLLRARFAPCLRRDPIHLHLRLSQRSRARSRWLWPHAGMRIRRATPRRGPPSVCRTGRAAGAPEGRRLHGGAHAPRHRRAIRRDRTPSRVHGGRRPRVPGRLDRRPAVRCGGSRSRAACRGRGDFRHRRPAVFVRADVRRRSEVRLQPHDARVWVADLVKGVLVGAALGCRSPRLCSG